MNPSKNKRQVDFHAIAQWVSKGERVLDLGCGRGVLLEYLKQKNQVYGVGVDIDFQKDIKLYQARGECLSGGY